MTVATNRTPPQTDSRLPRHKEGEGLFWTLLIWRWQDFEMEWSCQGGGEGNQNFHDQLIPPKQVIFDLIFLANYEEW